MFLSQFYLLLDHQKLFFRLLRQLRLLLQLRQQRQHDAGRLAGSGLRYAGYRQITTLDLTPMDGGGDPEVIRKGRGPLSTLGL